MNNSPDIDFRFPISPPTHQDAVVPAALATTTAYAASSSSACFNADDKTHHNRKKKRSKLIRLDNQAAPNKVLRPKYAKKPDPSAPKITKPCTECGKTFWSWKALFGHMRCHPERQWRGIDPPPNLRVPAPPNITLSKLGLAMGEEDHEAASSLLMLSSGITSGTSNEIIVTTAATQSVSNNSNLQGIQEVFDGGNINNSGRFECSSCKKVFSSHQALGGHRASHKNVKGCFAITRSDGEVDQDHHHHNEDGDGDGDGDGDDDVVDEDHMELVGSSAGHKCSVCWRVFSSGQALGGHMRCHWEKGEETQLELGLGFNLQQPYGTSKELLLGQNSGGSGGGLDLNLPAAAASTSHTADDQYCSSSYSSSGLTLDLRLGL